MRNRIALFFRKNLAMLTVVFLSLISIIPRTIQLFDNKDYLTLEPSIDYLEAKKIVVDHIFPLTGYAFGGLIGFPKVAWDYLISIPFAISSGNPFSLKFTMYLLSFSTVFFCFILTKKIFDKKTSYSIVFFLATSPLLIEYAGGIYPPFSIPILLVFYLFFIIKVFKNHSRYVYPLAIIVGLIAHFELAIAGVLFLQLAIYAVAGLIKQFIKVKQVFIAFLLFLSTIFPLFIFDIFNNFQNIRRITNFIYGSNKINLPFYQRASQHLDTFVWNFRTTFSPNVILSILLILLFSIGIYFYLKDKKLKQYEKQIALYLATSPIQFFILFLLYPGNLSGWWLSVLSVFYCFLAGILSGYFLNKQKLKHIVVAIVTILFIAFAFRTYTEFKNKFQFPPQINSIRVIEPIEYIYKDSSGKNFSYQVFPLYSPPGRRYDYESMFWWIGKNIGTNSKINAESKLKYVIVEPEYKGSNIFSDMELLLKLPSGIIVYRN